ncbi:hypothetical protein IIA95_00165 [Patescibacteria group bacterium]|nr:hypothetical protein [Patescibacteria group bacterium]
MLYLLYGKDTFRSRKNLHEILDVLEKKNKEAALYRINAESVDEESFVQLLRSDNLFGQKCIVVFEQMLESEWQKLLFENTKTMAESLNIYILFEENVSAPIVKKIGRISQKVQKFDLLKESELKSWIVKEVNSRGLSLSDQELNILISSFNSNLWAINGALELRQLGGDIYYSDFFYRPFELVDLFSKRQMRDAYLSFHKNRRGGITSEEMFWKLWWQVKMLLAVSSYKDEGLNNFQIKQKTGFHPFVIQKSLQALSRFSREELEKIFDELFTMWHESRLEQSDLSLKIERLLLGLN